MDISARGIPIRPRTCATAQVETYVGVSHRGTVARRVVGSEMSEVLHWHGLRFEIIPAFGGWMHVRKLLDWRKLLIYSHRWLGIVLGIVFVAWCVSGVVLMYYGVPHLTAGERLMRLPPLEVSSIRVTPAEAARQLKDPPRRLRISDRKSVV